MLMDCLHTYGTSFALLEVRPRAARLRQHGGKEALVSRKTWGSAAILIAFFAQSLEHRL
jgi:hypothetical protein